MAQVTVTSGSGGGGGLKFPTPPEIEEFKLPGRDTAREKVLTQRAGSAGLRTLRGGLQQGLSQIGNIDNPNVRAMERAKLLESFGTGVAQVTGAAGQVGTGQAEQEFQMKMEESRVNYRKKLQTAEQKYQGEVQQYLGEQKARELEADRAFRSSALRQQREGQRTAVLDQRNFQMEMRRMELSWSANQQALEREWTVQDRQTEADKTKNFFSDIMDFEKSLNTAASGAGFGDASFTIDPFGDVSEGVDLSSNITTGG